MMCPASGGMFPGMSRQGVGRVGRVCSVCRLLGGRCRLGVVVATQTQEGCCAAQHCLLHGHACIASRWPQVCASHLASSALFGLAAIAPAMRHLGVMWWPSWQPWQTLLSLALGPAAGVSPAGYAGRCWNV